MARPDPLRPSDELAPRRPILGCFEAQLDRGDVACIRSIRAASARNAAAAGEFSPSSSSRCVAISRWRAAWLASRCSHWSDPRTMFAARDRRSHAEPRQPGLFRRRSVDKAEAPLRVQNRAAGLRGPRAGSTGRLSARVRPSSADHGRPANVSESRTSGRSGSVWRYRIAIRWSGTGGVTVKIASDGAYDFADLFGRVGCTDNRDRRRWDVRGNDAVDRNRPFRAVRRRTGRRPDCGTHWRARQRRRIRQSGAHRCPARQGREQSSVDRVEPRGQQHDECAKLDQLTRDGLSPKPGSPSRVRGGSCDPHSARSIRGR